MNDNDPSANRIIAVTFGLSIAAACGFFAWGAFALLTMMTNPALTGEEYWSAVRDRAGANPLLAGAVVVFGLGTVVGVVLAVLAVVRRRGAK